MRRAVLLLVALAALVGATLPSPAHAGVDLDPYRGLGSWVDVFDYAQRAPAGRVAATGHARVGRRHGRARCAHALPPGGEPGRRAADRRSFDAALLGEFLSHAHDAGMRGGGVVPAVGRRRRGRLHDDATDRGVPRRRRAASTASRSTSRTRRAFPTSPSATTASSTSRSARASCWARAAPSARSCTRRCRPS